MTPKTKQDFVQSIKECILIIAHNGSVDLVVLLNFIDQLALDFSDAARTPEPQICPICFQLEDCKHKLTGTPEPVAAIKDLSHTIEFEDGMDDEEPVRKGCGEKHWIRAVLDSYEVPCTSVHLCPTCKDGEGEG